MSVYVVFALFSCAFLYLVAKTRKKPRLQGLSKFILLITIIYTATAQWGPAKYSADISQSPIIVGQEQYLLAWKINRLLPLQSLASPVYVKTNNIKKNAYLDVPPNIKSRLQNNYQSEPFYIQYLFYILLALLAAYYSIKARGRKKQTKPPKAQINKNIALADIDKITDLSLLKGQIDAIENAFLKRFHKKHLLPIYNQRYEFLRKRHAKVFYTIVYQLQKSHATFHETNTGVLPFIAKQLMLGESEFALEIVFSEVNKKPVFEQFAAKYKETHKVIKESRSARSIQGEIKDELEQQLKNTILQLAPKGLIHFNSKAKSRIELHLTLQDWENETNYSAFYIEGTVGEKGFLYLYPFVQLRALTYDKYKRLEVAHHSMLTSQYATLKSTFTNVLRAVDKLTVHNFDSLPTTKTPPALALVAKVWLMSLVLKLCIHNGPETQRRNQSIATESAINSLYMALGNELQTAIRDEISENTVAHLLEHNPHISEAIIGCSAIAALDFSINESMVTNLGGSLLSEALEWAFSG